MSGAAVGIISTGTVASAQLWVKDGLQLPRLAPSDRLLASGLIVSKRHRLAENGSPAFGDQTGEADLLCDTGGRLEVARSSAMASNCQCRVARFTVLLIGLRER